MNPENQEARPTTKFMTKKRKEAVERFKYVLGLHWLHVGYKVEFRIETQGEQNLLEVRVTEPHIKLWVRTSVPFDMIEHKTRWEASIVGTNSILWERLGAGLRGMRRDQMCWLRLKSRRDRRLKELRNGKEGSEEEGADGSADSEVPTEAAVDVR